MRGPAARCSRALLRMITIRREQMEVFERALWDRLVHDAVRHLREYFAVDAALLGDPGLHRVAAAAIARARVHGVVVEGDVYKYVNLAMALGTRFDEDPLLPWAAEILQRRSRSMSCCAHSRRFGSI